MSMARDRRVNHGAVDLTAVSLGGFLGRRDDASPIHQCPLCADIVAKVENRTTLKISRELIFGPLCYCVALQRHSVIDFGSTNTVPHIAARKTHQRL